jgi:hypothetical protein
MSDNIVDTSKPSAGRIYDYLLGGRHHFEIDRLAAEQIIAVAPHVPKLARLQRWALHDIATELSQNRGFDVIIDFASGLPTVDHIHTCVPEGTTVIYSDFDPVVVEFGQRLLMDIPNVHYFENDASRPEELLSRPEVQAILAGRRKVAFGYWGFCTFLTDAELAHSLRVLYDWSAPGSCLAYNAQSALDITKPDVLEAMKLYEQMGAPFHVRSLETHLGLLKPWNLEKTGFVSLLEWHGFDSSEYANVSKESFGPTMSDYGAFLTR